MSSEPYQPPSKSGVSLQVYQAGLHRAGPFLHAEATYLASTDFVATVVKQDWRNQRGNVSEMVWLYPEEVRLLATLALAIPEGRGSLRFAPLDRGALDWPLSRPLSSDDFIGVATAEAQALAVQHGSASIELGAWETASEEWQLRVFEAIDLSDELLIRGLHCLLKANRLAGDREFSAEGYMNVSISREAALELIRRRLQAKGHSSPSFRDAHDYVTANFRLGEQLANQLAYQHALAAAA